MPIQEQRTAYCHNRDYIIGFLQMQANFASHSLVFSAVPAEQFRPVLLRFHKRLPVSPRNDVGMMARKKYLGYRHSAKVRRPRILRIFQQPLACMRLIRSAL